MSDLQKWLDEQDSARDAVGYPRLAALAALRAVVELHKPVNRPHGHPVEWCASCTAVWPCPTIRAIEKEVLR